MKVSIVTASFNAATTIADTLNSILHQTYKDIESIVVDGGSTDETLEIVRSFGKRVSNIVSEPDRGCYDAMNKGLHLATGDIVAFLNADDYYASDSVLADVVHTFERKGASVVAGAIQQIRPNGRIVRRIRVAYSDTRMRWGVAPPHPALFMLTDLARAAGGFNSSYKYAGDFDLLLKASRLPTFHISLLPQVLTMMRTGGYSTSGRLIYARMTPELIHALRNDTLSYGHWRAHFRGLWKLPELICLPRKVANRFWLRE